MCKISIKAGTSYVRCVPSDRGTCTVRLVSGLNQFATGSPAVHVLPNVSSNYRWLMNGMQSIQLESEFFGQIQASAQIVKKYRSICSFFFQ
jgi:hypothetical protein